MKMNNGLLVRIFLMASLWPLSSQASDPVEVEVFLEMRSCPGCDLSGAFLDTVAAIGGDLGDANLRDASLYRMNLDQANLSGADMTGVNLKWANLNGADLSNATLYNADLTYATLVNAKTTLLLTDGTTTCPDGTSGPCNFQEGN
ncbi:MAG: pentapeptide repeat-containing protein [Deltaproteobacteria bacterium]|nr:pentapeptide repeat-containing protein [Deltaproteobacteria bacterium]